MQQYWRRQGTQVFASCLLLLLMGGVPMAEASGQTAAETKQIQDHLTWTTDYEGLIDGVAGDETTKAISKFQSGLGHQPTGQLSPAEFATLKEQGTAAKTKAGFRLTIDDEAGISIGIPLNLVSSVDGKKTKWGKHWDGKSRDLSIDTLRFKDVQLEQLYDRLRTINNRSVQYARLSKDKDWFVVAAFEKGAAVYVRVAIVSQPDAPKEIRGFSLWMGKDRPPTYQALAPAMLSSFSTKSPAPAPTPPPPVATSTKPNSSQSFTTGRQVQDTKPRLEAGQVITVPPPAQGDIRINRPAPSLADCINGLGPVGCPLAFR
jgi:hypothetical protein